MHYIVIRDKDRGDWKLSYMHCDSEVARQVAIGMDRALRFVRIDSAVQVHVLTASQYQTWLDAVDDAEYTLACVLPGRVIEGSL